MTYVKLISVVVWMQHGLIPPSLNIILEAAMKFPFLRSAWYVGLISATFLFFNYKPCTIGSLLNVKVKHSTILVFNTCFARTCASRSPSFPSGIFVNYDLLGSNVPYIASSPNLSAYLPTRCLGRGVNWVRRAFTTEHFTRPLSKLPPLQFCLNASCLL